MHNVRQAPESRLALRRGPPRLLSQHNRAIRRGPLPLPPAQLRQYSNCTEYVGLLQLHRGACIHQLLLHLFRLGLGDTFLNRLGSAVDQVLGLLEA